METLTVSQQRYINTVYELWATDGHARVCDVAAGVGVTKTSACMAVKRLQSKGLLGRDAARRVFLTEKGVRHALSSQDKTRVLQRFLVRVLGVEGETARAEARALAHAVSRKTLCALCRFTRDGLTGTPSSK